MWMRIADVPLDGTLLETCIRAFFTLPTFLIDFEAFYGARTRGRWFQAGLGIGYFPLNRTLLYEPCKGGHFLVGELLGKLVFA
jgi:hypothetical protein